MSSVCVCAYVKIYTLLIKHSFSPAGNREYFRYDDETPHKTAYAHTTFPHTIVYQSHVCDDGIEEWKIHAQKIRCSSYSESRTFDWRSNLN